MDEVLLREKLAHIDLMLAQHDLTVAQHDRVRQEINFAPTQQYRLRQEIRYAPLVLLASGITSGGALFAAAFALAKFLK
jgi:hypothetical protein